jgi:peptidoglycan/LPS O-acetylase OafA/YrhL
LHTPLEIILRADHLAARHPRRTRPTEWVRWVSGRAAPHALTRIGWIDVIRAVVCLCIVAGHNGLPAGLGAESGVGPVFDTFNRFRPGTECFMAVSGFFLGHMLRPRGTPTFSVRGFLHSRVIRLAVPYWVAVTLAYLLWLAAAWLVEGYRTPPSAAGVAADYLFVTDLVGSPWAVYSFWSLATLFQAYFLWTGLFWAVRQGFLAAGTPRPHGRTTAVLSALAVGLVAWGGWVLMFPRHGVRWMLPENAAYLAAGWLVYQTVVGQVGRWVVPFVAGVLFAAGVVSGSPRPVYAAAVAVVLAVAARAGTANLPRPARWLAVVGTYSFSIYLTHGFVGHKVYRLTDQLGWPANAVTAVALFALTVAVSVGLGVAFYHLVERRVFAGMPAPTAASSGTRSGLAPRGG